jgi:hypothetical protein
VGLAPAAVSRPACPSNGDARRANCYGELWAWETVQGVIKDAFGHRGTPLRVSDPEVAAGRDCFSLLRLSDGTGYSVDVSLPLDGEWSDLTIQLEFLERPQGLAMVLHDVHVM